MELVKEKIDEAKKVLEEAAKQDVAEQKRIDEAIQAILKEAGYVMLPRFHGDIHDGKYAVNMGFVLLKKEEADAGV